jgi:hypothetical protein
MDFSFLALAAPMIIALFFLSRFREIARYRIRFSFGFSMPRDLSGRLVTPKDWS